jgi:hypothetical protein
MTSTEGKASDILVENFSVSFTQSQSTCQVVHCRIFTIENLLERNSNELSSLNDDSDCINELET